MNARLFSLAALAAALAGCTPIYQTLELDTKTGSYATSSKVEPAAILTFDTSVDARVFPMVLLFTDSNIRPQNFAFTARLALAHSGNLRVFNPDEFRQFAEDRGFKFSGFEPETMRRFSAEVAPLLVVDMRHRLVAEARWQSSVRLTDGRNGQDLLLVQHPRHVWFSPDSEALYPLLNEMLRWFKESRKI